MTKERASGLAGWLQERCREERLTLRQAAGKTGLSHTTIAKIMEGVRPSAGTVKKCAEGFSDNGTEKLILEDELLILAGYRTARAEPREQVAQLIGKLSQFNDAQVKIVRDFINFIAGMEKN